MNDQIEKYHRWQCDLCGVIEDSVRLPEGWDFIEGFFDDDMLLCCTGCLEE